MKPDEIAPIADPTFGRTSRPHAHTGPMPVRPERQPENRPGHDVFTKPPLDHIQFNKLETSNADSQKAAQAIRQINQSMETISSYLQQMRASLESIVKIYPPYPPGSSERIEALRQFSTLRKMIDQIADPAPLNSMTSADPFGKAQSGDWTPQAGHRAFEVIIRNRQIHTGPDGLDIPDIDIDCTDQQITTAVERTSSAMHTLIARRRNFIADANRAIAQLV